MMSKPNLTIFLTNLIGGVQSYCATLVQAGAFDRFDVRYIAFEDLKAAEWNCTKLKTPLGGAPTDIFIHGQPENVYHMFRRMGRLLPDGPGIILANFREEMVFLDACRQREKTIVYVCHDETVYVEPALTFAHVIDAFVVHNPYLVDYLRDKLPPHRSKDIHFLPFGIRQDRFLRRAVNPDRNLKMVFIGRLDEKKGILDLPLIDDRLREAGVKVEWSILGCGPAQEKLEQAIGGRDNFCIDSPVDNRDMLKKASLGDVFVFPTRVDGTPVALMEALSVGLVPVVSEFNPGVHWMTPPETGFICPLDPHEMASRILRLHANRDELENRSSASARHAAREFDIESKAQEYARAFTTFLGYKIPPTVPPAKYGGRLDQPWIPNFVTSNYRQWQDWMHS